jgi:hypothetical protein
MVIDMTKVPFGKRLPKVSDKLQFVDLVTKTDNLRRSKTCCCEAMPHKISLRRSLQLKNNMARKAKPFRSGGKAA